MGKKRRHNESKLSIGYNLLNITGGLHIIIQVNTLVRSGGFNGSECQKLLNFCQQKNIFEVLHTKGNLNGFLAI